MEQTYASMVRFSIESECQNLYFRDHHAPRFIKSSWNEGLQVRARVACLLDCKEALLLHNISDVWEQSTNYSLRLSVVRVYQTLLPFPANDQSQSQDSHGRRKLHPRSFRVSPSLRGSSRQGAGDYDCILIVDMPAPWLKSLAISTIVANTSEISIRW